MAPLNHYERLKVTQDAPAEVIRAAYRALAGKLHPDRHGAQHIGPDSSSHAEMAAINAAYEVLNDPAARAEYDATLLAQALGGSAETVSAASAVATPSGAAEASKVDVDWMHPHLQPQSAAWGWNRRTVLVSSVAALALLVAGVWGGREVVVNHQMERALSDQYSAHGELGGAADSPMPAVLQGHEPSEQELARMSNEQLLQVLPDLTVAAAPLPSNPLQMASPSKPHPLDGSPLNLRTDGQLEDLAAQPSASR